MTANPETGERDVGGAGPNPGNASTDAATIVPPVLCERPTRAPFPVLVASLAWQANQAITRQVQATYRWAELTRANAEALAHRAETSVPQGPMRSTVSAIADAMLDYADAVAGSAMRFGRSFGHQAFAFPATGQACNGLATGATTTNFPWSP